MRSNGQQGELHALTAEEVQKGGTIYVHLLTDKAQCGHLYANSAPACRFDITLASKCAWRARSHPN